LAQDPADPTHEERVAGLAASLMRDGLKVFLDANRGSEEEKLVARIKKGDPNRDLIKAIEAWNGQGCLVVNIAPQLAGRVFNASGRTIHGIRVEMKTVQ
jgi:hypothetical protein